MVRLCQFLTLKSLRLEVSSFVFGKINFVEGVFSWFSLPWKATNWKFRNSETGTWPFSIFRRYILYMKYHSIQSRVYSTFFSTSTYYFEIKSKKEWYELDWKTSYYFQYIFLWKCACHITYVRKSLEIDCAGVFGFEWFRAKQSVFKRIGVFNLQKSVFSMWK